MQVTAHEYKNMQPNASYVVSISLAYYTIALALASSRDKDCLHVSRCKDDVLMAV